MPLSVLRGWQDPAARWTEPDTLLAAALTLAEESICTGCGHPLHESTDPAHDAQDPEGSARYVALNPVRCFACTAVAEKAKHYESAAAPRALRFGTVLRSREVPNRHIAGRR